MLKPLRLLRLGERERGEVSGVRVLLMIPTSHIPIQELTARHCLGTDPEAWLRVRTTSTVAPYPTSEMAPAPWFFRFYFTIFLFKPDLHFFTKAVKSVIVLPYFQKSSPSDLSITNSSRPAYKFSQTHENASLTGNFASPLKRTLGYPLTPLNPVFSFT